MAVIEHDSREHCKWKFTDIRTLKAKRELKETVAARFRSPFAQVVSQLLSR